jgi:DNA-binding MarR family transcriptional regulator
VTAMSKRKQILDDLARVGREHSDATVLFHSHIAERMGLHPTDYKALGLLERLGPMSAGDLGRHAGLATASVTNLIDRLEGKGYARRIRDTDDRRRVLVEVVRDRLGAGAELFGSTRRSLARLYEGYSDRDLTVIADFLGRNAERLREETRKLSQQADPDPSRGGEP